MTDDARTSLPDTMAAVLLTGHGGLDQLEYRTDVPVPTAGPGQVLINVRAAGVNNTDVNTRIGWYSKSVNTGTDDGDTGSRGIGAVDAGDAAWSGSTIAFPRIQGADVCGVIVAVGDGVAPGRIGERVLTRAMPPKRGPHGELVPFVFETLGADRDGGFAQFTVAASIDAIAVNSDWTDVELGSIPCASSTAENMLRRSTVGAERVLITGASGGVGSALVQLAARRGAVVIAVCGAAKSDAVLELGANRVIDRDADLLDALGSDSVDVVADLVAGLRWPNLLDVLRPGGRYVTSGAIAGPMVELDVRTLYLKDLLLLGATYQPPEVFTDIVGYIERNEIRPSVAATFPLSDITSAQTEFLTKRHVGKIVVVPPPTS
jgi:NADPH:quinone reductase-like Zn-dependent oxidoreductase